MTIGVRRFDKPLMKGVAYSLNVNADAPLAAAFVFLFTVDGEVAPIKTENGQTAMAKTGVPLTFNAPSNIAGFYVQVQSDWRRHDSITIGIRRFMKRLVAGVEYVLTVDAASDGRAAVLLFLISDTGLIVPFTHLNHFCQWSLHLVRQPATIIGRDLSFRSPRCRYLSL